MKDWKRSPEPPSMMGSQPPVQSATPPTESQSSHSSLDEVLPGVYFAPFLGNESSSKMASMAAAAEEEAHERQARQDARASKMMSLKSMAMAVICRNIHMVEDIGAMPYSLAGPVLRHCSASQLMVIEGNSPEGRGGIV
ncbi:TRANSCRIPTION ELONGATION FACTOR B POLYPEPTIDE 3 [Ceraceosorus bombacis]|uniref:TRANSCRIPTION ELONGATION FACTOR B POLYPEPTIDE 3 n=1 Tax=Ceraceosorus bombacis TaxID=401625 RepID=A0A0N7LAG1_9BASI|nr:TRANSCRIPTION ELONGATION FACTOR B POLYPEPTIDE 3 [Ceraceosorus bombacis]